MKRTLTAAVILFSAIVMLAGCNKAGDKATASTAGSKDPITFTFFTADATEDMPFTDPVAQEITKRTGVTLQVDHPVAGDTQAIPLMMASGDYSDLIYAKGELTKLIDADAIVPLDDLIEKYGANMKDLYGDQIVRLKTSIEDPTIYSVGTYGVKQAVLETSGTMQLQHAVLKELGYPRIETLAGYEKALRDYIAKYPTINGQKTIGLSLLIDTWQWYIDLSNPGNYVIGYPDDGQWIVDPKTMQATYKFLHPDMDVYYRWLNKLNADGILDPESFTQKEDVWKAKIASGRVLGIAYPNWGYGDARASLIQNGMPERTYAYFPVVADKKYRDPSLKDYGFSGGWGIAITTACEDPVRAFQFLDWMCSEEAQVLVNWGIKDVNYQVIDGKRVVPAAEQAMADSDPDYSKKTGVGRWIYPFPQRGTAAVDKNGDWITRTSRERIVNNFLPVEKETLAAYGVELYVDLFPQPAELGVSKHGQVWQYALPPDVNEKVTAADEYVKGALARIVLGKPADFDASWKKMVDELKKMGMEDANTTLTQMIQDKINMWNAN